MKRCFSAPVVSLVLVFLLTFLIPTAHAGPEASFRPARVRAFAPESPTSLIVREGRSRFVRLTLAERCPALSQASRLALQTGSSLAAADETGRQLPVVRGPAPGVISSETPHAYIVAIDTNSRTVCRLAGVAVVGQAAFEAAAAAFGSRDNRYAGDGRPAG